MAIKELTIWQAFRRAIEWRIVAVMIDFTVVFLLTRKLVLSVGITSISNGVRTVVHAFWIKKRGHEVHITPDEES